MAGTVPPRGHGWHVSQPNEGAHDLDVHLNGALAAQHARQHRDALLGEDVGAGAPAAPSV
jgi:hypothetical protein